MALFIMNSEYWAKKYWIVNNEGLKLMNKLIFKWIEEKNNDSE